jgi:hypothetical protein
VTAPSQESRPQQSASEALEAHVNGNRMASTFHLVGLDFAQRQAEEIDRLRLLLSEKESINAAPQGTEGYGLCDDNLGNVPAVAAPSSGDKRQQFTCPKCGHVGADSPGRLPLCDRCDYKVRMLPSHNGRILAPRTDAIAKWQEHVTVDDYNRMVDHARELEAELSVTPSHGGERLYTEAQVREACERAIAPILEKLNSMPSASGGSSEPRGGPWNVGDQQEPDGYVVLIKDAGSAKRGYWLSHAYVDRSFADRGAEACKGEVMPIYFAQSSASIPQDTADTLRDLIDYACAFVPLTWEGRQTHQEIMKRGLQLLAAIDASESRTKETR